MPQRFLRPGITNSDAWNAVSFGAQSLYVRILTLVDDYGRYDGRLPILHSHCFALRPDVTPQDSEVFRNELHESGLIVVYTVGGKEFLQVTKWQERTRGPSKFPEPPQESAGIRRNPLPNPASLASVPSPSHRHESAPAPSVAPAQDCAEIPSREKAIELADMQGAVPADFAGYVFDDWEGRSGKDASGCLVEWLPYVRKRWGRERNEWSNGTHKGRKQPAQTQDGPTLTEVKAHAANKHGGGDATVYAVSFWQFWHGKGWRKNGKRFDWQTQFDVSYGKHRANKQDPQPA